MITAEELGKIIVKYHTHAAICYDHNPDQIVYREADVVKLLVELGFPEAKFERDIKNKNYGQRKNNN